MSDCLCDTGRCYPCDDARRREYDRTFPKPSGPPVSQPGTSSPLATATRTYRGVGAGGSEDIVERSR